MRRNSLIAMLPLFTIAPLAGQGFEGVVSVKMAAMGATATDAQWFVKGDKAAAKLFMPANAGPAAGKEGRLIVDASAMTMTMLIPMEMGGMKGMKSVTDLRKEAQSGGKAEVKALGTSETIAGHRCDNIQRTEGKSVTVLCITTEMGHFVMGSGGMMGSAGNWASVLVDHPGFPLRVVTNGKTNWEVTGVKPGTVPPEMFIMPEGYMDMPNFGGMGRGGGQ